MWSSYNPCSLFPPINLQRPHYIFPAAQRMMTNSTVCFVSEEKQKKKKKKITVIETSNNIEESSNELDNISTPCTEKRLERNGSEWMTYQIAAVMFSVGITSVVVAAGYYRFSWQMQDEEIPGWEMFGTFVVSIGAAVGMEYWAKWAHRRIWHSSLWQIHEVLTSWIVFCSLTIYLEKVYLNSMICWRLSMLFQPSLFSFMDSSTEASFLKSASPLV